MKKIQKSRHHKGSLARLSAVLLMITLLLSMLVFAQAEQLNATPTPGLGLNTPTPTPKPTRTPKPTKTPKPTPTEYPFEPGLREDHEGHKIEYQILDSNDWRHTIKEYCSTCRMTIKAAYTEDHQLDAEGHCLKCSYRCKHDHTYVREVPADGGEKTWDGNWISYPGTEITVCYRCNKYLKYENTIIRKFHNRHTRFLPEQECLPHDADTHALVRICEDCGTEVIKYVPHNCPPSDRPYTDDGDSDTHSRLVRCDDCGFWVPQQQPHTWVHDSYKKDDTDGGEEGHIEVMKCTVCGAEKAIWQLHDAGIHVAYRQSGNADTHIEVLQCPVCNETFEKEQPHELEHVSCRNDGDTNTHIEVLVCTLCEAEAEKREAHRPVHIGWEDISNKQHQETVRCNMCGLTYTLAPVAHSFSDYPAGQYYVSDGATSHRTYYWKCSICGAIDYSNYIKEAHRIYGDHVSCLKCDYTKEGHTHEINYNLPYKCMPLNAAQHITRYACKNPSCLVQLPGDPQPHTFAPVTLKCTVCGYLKEGCEHHYTYKPVRNGVTEEQHTVIGTCTGCGKQITVTGEHDMQFVSATEYVSCGDLQHTRNVTERCSLCGYEVRHTETENHAFSSGESLGAQEHKQFCTLCGAYGITEPHLFVCTSDESAHVCSVCGEKGEHDYFIAEYRCDGAWIYHTVVYKCRGCMRLDREERQKHPVETFFEPYNEVFHWEHIRCPLCDIRTSGICDHVFDESGTCVCGYHRGDPIHHAPLPGEGLPENSGDGAADLPAFCHLTADGKEMPFGHELILSDEAISENGKAFSFIILPEGISGDVVIEIRFTASELALLQALGVKSVYIRPGENDILLLDDVLQALVLQALTALTGQEIDELVITLTPGSDGVYIVQYDPAGVYITE